MIYIINIFSTRLAQYGYFLVELAKKRQEQYDKRFLSFRKLLLGYTVLNSAFINALWEILKGGGGLIIYNAKKSDTEE
jgi:hypothetical protein